MSMETRKAMLDSQKVVDGRVHVDEAYSASLRDSVILCDTTTAALTVTLPSVSEARGKVIYVYDEGGAAGTTNITVADFKNDAGLTDITIATNNGSVTLFSDGMRWITLQSDLT